MKGYLPKNDQHTRKHTIPSRDGVFSIFPKLIFLQPSLFHRSHFAGTPGHFSPALAARAST